MNRACITPQMITAKYSNKIIRINSYIYFWYFYFLIPKDKIGNDTAEKFECQAKSLNEYSRYSTGIDFIYIVGISFYSTPATGTFLSTS